jgi:hypothetical protein
MSNYLGKKQYLFTTLALLSLGLFLFVLPATVAAQAVAQSYTSSSSLEPGMVVIVNSKDTTEVSPATQATASEIHGVVVAANATPIVLSNNSVSQQIYVATTGNYQVLVSNQNGAIQTGNDIAMSSLAGVGMKAGSNQNIVLGKALSSFNGTTNVLGTTTLKENGQNTKISLGYVSVALSLSHNPLYVSVKTEQISDVLQKFGNTVAQKNVSPLRIYISIAVLIISATIAGSLLYAGVRTSMVALGRNPLARRSILHSLVQVVFISLVVFVFGLFAVYLLLKL